MASNKDTNNKKDTTRLSPRDLELLRRDLEGKLSDVQLREKYNITQHTLNYHKKRMGFGKQEVGVVAVVGAGTEENNNEEADVLATIPDAEREAPVEKPQVQNSEPGNYEWRCGQCGHLWNGDNKQCPSCLVRF